MSEFLHSIGYSQWALHALIILPLLGIIPILVAPVPAARRIALVVTVVELLISLGLWWAYVPSPGMQLVSSVPWIPRLGVSYAVGIDGISLVMVLLSTGLMPLAVLSSYTYITKHERAYYALLLAQAVGMIGCFIATDLFVFYVYFELLLIPMYFLIGIWGGTNRLYAAIAVHSGDRIPRR